MLFPSRVAGRLEASWRSFELGVFFFQVLPIAGKFSRFIICFAFLLLQKDLHNMGDNRREYKLFIHL